MPLETLWATLSLRGELFRNRGQNFVLFAVQDPARSEWHNVQTTAPGSDPKLDGLRFSTAGVDVVMCDALI